MYGISNNRQPVTYGSIDRDDDRIEGYCLVFYAKTKYCELYIEGSKLCVFKDSLHGLNPDHPLQATGNLLQDIEECQIDYKILRSQDQKWIFVIITAKEQIIEARAEQHLIDVQVDPANAIKLGRQLPNFALAHHTKILDDSDRDDSSIFEERNIRFTMLSQQIWSYIYIPFDQRFDRNIYKPALNRSNRQSKIFSQHLYLRLLYDILVRRKELGGAEFIIDQYIYYRHHPLKCFFALHQCPEKRPRNLVETSLKCLCFWFPSTQGVAHFCEDVRVYHGEAVAFYFVYLVYYGKCLLLMAIIGAIWFVVQVSLNSVAIPGSTIIVLIAIIWTTLTNQFWYRKEYKYRAQWGLLRYGQTDILRSWFKGYYTVSTTTGLIIEAYRGKCLHYFKRILSMFAVLGCSALATKIVIVSWTLQYPDRENYIIGMGVGILNGLQIIIGDIFYKKFATFLTDWAGYRLESDWYNNMVIKRIIFSMINYNFSLFYIAFWDNREAYNDNSVRLSALRLQLIILSFMVLIYQTLSPVVPKWFGDIKHLCTCTREDDELDDIETRTLITESPFGPKVSKAVIEDINEQINLCKLPNILDTTSDIIMIHGYIIMFCFVFPLMPLLAICSTYFKFKAGVYYMEQRQRGVPHTSDGIGVWKNVISVFNYVAIFSNLALLIFRTDLTDTFIGSDKYVKVIVFLISSMILSFGTLIMNYCIGNISQLTKEHIERQNNCRKELLKAASKFQK